MCKHFIAIVLSLCVIRIGHFLWLSRESLIQGDRNGDECSGKLYEASGAGRNTAQRLGKYGRRMDPCANIEAGARIHVSEGMVKDVTVMKYEENG